jgi:hypothetical protein
MITAIIVTSGFFIRAEFAADIGVGVYGHLVPCCISIIWGCDLIVNKQKIFFIGFFNLPCDDQRQTG